MLPISSQTLFSNYGIECDILERELKFEGFLYERENLWDVLSNSKNLKRTIDMPKEPVGDFPDDWQEEDFISYFERKESGFSF